MHCIIRNLALFVCLLEYLVIRISFRWYVGHLVSLCTLHYQEPSFVCLSAGISCDKDILPGGMWDILCLCVHCMSHEEPSFVCLLECLEISSHFSFGMSNLKREWALKLWLFVS